ncbi:uncharacterized protein LOC142222657 [Haematobia irritans]|uniref:uncharacterized protein LOC142222657 n=1 Tax=Haematobia irritans TaxID=7368 RepID=UPI003F4F7F20
MVKDSLLFASILVLAAAVVIHIHAQSIIEGCVSETELWGSVDGTKFYFCLGDNMALEQSCDPGTFFVKNTTVAGCVPVADVDDKCIYHDGPPTCTGESLYQPQPHEMPNNFYLCTMNGAEPQVMKCPDEKAFVNQNGYLGCFDWSNWREIRGCVNE